MIGGRCREGSKVLLTSPTCDMHDATRFVVLQKALDETALVAKKRSDVVGQIDDGLAELAWFGFELDNDHKTRVVT